MNEETNVASPQQTEIPSVGQIAWQDLTVAPCEQVRDFYQAVVGWKSDPVAMGDYSDFNMLSPTTNQPVAGICHARGANAALPAQWLLYITVADVQKSADRCVALGGAIVAPVCTLGDGCFCVIRDPAGAVCALYSPCADKTMRTD